MIPDLVSLNGSPWKVLPAGMHQATLEEVKAMYAASRYRRQLFDGLVVGVKQLSVAGCQRVYVDGSFVTSKPRPGDFDACWDPSGVQELLLDPIFKDFSNGRAAQKAAFKGEFFPSSLIEGGCGRAFVDFFQVDRFSGDAKGILLIDLSTDPTLGRSAA